MAFPHPRSEIDKSPSLACFITDRGPSDLGLKDSSKLQLSASQSARSKARLANGHAGFETSTPRCRAKALRPPIDPTCRVRGTDIDLELRVL